MTGTAAQQPEHALAGQRFPNRRNNGFQNAGTTVSISPDWRYPATGIFNCEYYNGYKDGYKIKYVVHKANTEKNHVVLQYYLENSSKQKIQGEIRFLNNEKGGYNIEWSGVFLDMDTKTLGSLFFNTGIDPALYDGKSKNGLDFKITSGSVTEINAQAAILKNSLTASKQLFSEFHNNVLKPAGYSIADLGFVKIF